MKRWLDPSLLAWPLMIVCGLGIAYAPELTCEVLNPKECGLTALEEAEYNIRFFGWAIIIVSLLMWIFGSVFARITRREWFESGIAAAIAAVLSLLLLPAKSPLDYILSGFVVLVSATTCVGAAKGLVSWCCQRKGRQSRLETNAGLEQPEVPDSPEVPKQPEVPDSPAEETQKTGPIVTAGTVSVRTSRANTGAVMAFVAGASIGYALAGRKHR